MAQHTWHQYHPLPNFAQDPNYETFIKAVNIDETLKGKELKKAKAVAREFKKKDDENGILAGQRYVQLDDEIQALLDKQKAIQEYNWFADSDDIVQALRNQHKAEWKVKTRLEFLEKIKKNAAWYANMSYPQDRVGVSENPYFIEIF